MPIKILIRFRTRTISSISVILKSEIRKEKDKDKRQDSKNKIIHYYKRTHRSLLMELNTTMDYHLIHLYLNNLNIANLRNNDNMG
nr:hypothetical protein [Clostridia bacterium]